MKQLTFALLLALGLLGCGKDQPATGADGIAVAEENRVDNNVPSTGQGFVGEPEAPPTELRETQALLRNFWVFEFYIDRKNPDNRIAKKGKWYKFEPDGTFTGGQWQDQTHAGVYRVYRKDNKVMLLIDSNNDSEDAEFDMQGLTGDAEAMSWVGTSRFDMSHVILKAINLLTRPTKEQFGVTE